MQSAALAYTWTQWDIRPASGHVGGDRYLAGQPRTGNHRGLLAILARVQ
jgi:hypothetical protein